MSSDIELIKPAFTTKKYRLITLQNKLRVILVSDTNLDSSAACLIVGTGSIRDPPDRNGLSHFLEHMLFMGTKKYPDEGEFAKFISEHAGHDNASTGQRTTNYYFNIDSKYFNEALDRFAQFFISPLFNESCTMRELNIVHSEHQKNQRIDSWRLRQILRNFSNKDHYFHIFSTGSVQTLNPEGSSILETRERLIQYFNKYYSASLMSLALVGTQSLDELQEMAEEYFSPIANFDVPTIDEEILGKEYVKQLSESSQKYTQICSDLIRNYYLGKNKKNKDEKLNEQQHDDKDQQGEDQWELEWKKKCEKYGDLHQSGVLVLHPNSSIKSSSDSKNIIIKPPSLIPLPNNNTIFPEDVFNSNQIYVVLNYRQAAILSLQFLMPSSYPFSFLSSPIHIISHLIGHEGNGSLLSELRKKMLASELTTSVTQQNSDFIVFKMDIQLTQEGSNQIEEIIDICFQYIDMLKQTVGIPVEQQLQQTEQQNSICNQEQTKNKLPIYIIADILLKDILEFHTQESSEPLNQALNYSHNLLDFSPEYAICGCTISPLYNEEQEIRQRN
ncbi:MAG: putative Insulin-degrading enzyme [Streblomastix strix]|uniref:Putative Insulin-degrading enzyme n=1 Tax=Streblomastix strix TaxID=222440 RepID=A0A5J4WS92_9EUKA|nr:MAG: putative Insulin-degrading enzyme [Streblomastix strix]